MRKLVITGSGGFLGTWLVNKLLRSKKFNLNLPFEDLTSPDFKINPPDVLIHLAAKHPSYKGDIFRINYETTKRLAAMCSKETHFIFLSTDYVFKGEEHKEYTECDIKQPQTEYGRSKSLSEDYLLNKLQNVSVLRTSMLYGYDNPLRDNFINFLKKELLRNNQIDLFDNVYCRPTHVEDLSEFIVRVVERQLYGTYHACSSDYINRYELGKVFCKVNGHDAALLRSVNTTPKEWPKRLNLKPSQLFLETAKIPLAEGLKYGRRSLNG